MAPWTKINDVDAENIRKIEGLIDTLSDDVLPILQQTVIGALVERYSRNLIGRFFSQFTAEHGKVENPAEK